MSSEWRKYILESIFTGDSHVTLIETEGIDLLENENRILRNLLQELTTEEFYWRYKPWIDDEGKQHPGLIKNITMIQEYIKEEMSKLK